MQKFKLKGDFEINFKQEIVDLLDQLSIDESYIYEIDCNDTEKILVKKLLDAMDHMSIWYGYQRALINSLSIGKNNLVIEYLANNYKKMHKDDKQFPPDIIKCQRLFLLLSIIAPSTIIELGCGTSSHIISLYADSVDNNVEWRTIDSDKDWLNTTYRKIDKNQKKSSKSNFLLHRDNESTLAQMNKLFETKGCCFVYLDANLSDKDHYQGLDILLKAELKDEPLYLMIDSRVKAVKNLDLLAKKLGKKIQVITNVALREKSNKKLDSAEDIRIMFDIHASRLIATPTFYTLAKLI